MKRRRCLKQKGRNKRAEMGAKSERAERKLEGSLLPFSAFFSFLWFFFVCFFSFFYLRKRRCQEKVFET
jgi:hypothetical protein